MKKQLLIISLILTSSLVYGQVKVLGTDSLSLGNTSLNSGTSLFGKIYLKNYITGTSLDSILVINASGRVQMVPKSVLLAGYAKDNGLVHISNSETISGEKTFTSNTIQFGGGLFLRNGARLVLQGAIPATPNGNYSLLSRDNETGFINAENISNLPVSSAMQASLNLKADKTLTFSGDNSTGTRYITSLLDGSGILADLKSGTYTVPNTAIQQIIPSFLNSAAFSEVALFRHSNLSQRLGFAIVSSNDISNSEYIITFQSAAGLHKVTKLIGDNDVVHRTGNETISGLKTFTNEITNFNTSISLSGINTEISLSDGRSSIFGQGTGIVYRLGNNDATNYPDYSKSYTFRNRGFNYLTMGSVPTNGGGTDPLAYNYINMFGLVSITSNNKSVKFYDGGIEWFPANNFKIRLQGDIPNTDINLTLPNQSGRLALANSFDTGQTIGANITGNAASATVASSVLWTNVSGRPSSLSSFSNDVGYLTAGGSINYANSAGSVAWGNVSGRPGGLSSFSNDVGYVTGSGRVDGTNRMWSSTHPNDFYLFNEWTGSHWYLRSNHPSPVRVGYSDVSGSVDWSGISNRPTNVSSFVNDMGYINDEADGLQSVTTRWASTNKNLYLYKGGSNDVDQGSSIFFNSEGGGSPTYSQAWQIGANGDMINYAYTVNRGEWRINATFENFSGNLVTVGTVNGISDVRLKNNIFNLKPVSESLRKIRAVEYDRIDTKQHQLGFIAQEMQKYFPDLVNTANDEKKTLSVAYQNFTAPLLKGWQEHDEIITKQAEQLQSQEQKINKQAEQIDDLKKQLAEIKEMLKDKK